MMQNMRDKTQGVIAGAIAVLIALTFALWGVQNYLSTGANQAAATVNGEEITQQQLRSAYEQAKRMEMLKTNKSFVLDQKGQSKFKKDVLQYLIKQQIILQAAKKMGIGLGRNQLWAVVTGMPAFQIDGQFSLGRFQQIISNVFFSEQAFFDDLQNSFVQAQLEKSIANSSFLLPNEIVLIKKIFKQRRDFGYFMVSPDRFNKEVSITKDDIQKYYDEHQNEFALPEKISIQYLELYSGDLQSKIKPTNEQLKQFYQSHIDFFSAPKKWQITRVLVPLAPDADEKSVEAAKEELEKISKQAAVKKELASDDSKVQITTSWVKRVGLTSEIASQLEKLNVNQVSVPFRTQEGYNLLKVLAVQAGKAKLYANAVDDVRKVYIKQELAQSFSDASDKLADLVYINSDSLKPAAKDLGLKLKETKLFTKDSVKSGVLSNQKVVNSAFSDVVLKQRYNSSLIEFSSGKIVVLRVKEHVPEAIRPLNKVKDVIVSKLQRQESQKKADKFVNGLLDDLRGGESEKALAKKHNLMWHTIKNARYGEPRVSAKLVNAAFDLPKPESKDSSLSVIDLDGSFVVIRLDKVYYVSGSNEDERADLVLKLYPQMLGRFDYQSLLENLMGRAKIKIMD